MAEENDQVLTEVMALLEAEPSSSTAASVGPDIPAHREQLAIVVSTGKCKEAIGVNLTQDQVKRLEDKDVMKYSKRYKTYVGANTVETLIESFLSFSVKALGMFVQLKDFDSLRNELRKRLHHHKGAVTTIRLHCAEMWRSSCCSQRASDHRKTCRYQR